MKRKITILYGSQTGVAQDLAEQIWRESKMYYFTGIVTGMDSYDIRKLINENIVIFVCSTTGQGEEPDNMKIFWKFLLRKGLPTDSLSGVRFGVLGLGDSSYAKFNFVAKKLNKRLLQLGGNCLIPLGLCDDQHDLGISGVSIKWISNLWKLLLGIYPIPENLPILTQSPRQFRWNIEISDENSNTNSICTNIFDAYSESVYDSPFKTEVMENIRTTSENHFQEVRLITFNVQGINWSPGDVFVCRPINQKDNVTSLFDLFKEHNLPFYPSQIINIKQIDEEMPVPTYLQNSAITLETIATELWDLNAIPRPRFFELLSLNCTNEMEKEKLIEFTKPETQEDLYTYANRPRRTVLESLYDFPHAVSKLNIQILFELFQTIKPRSFSIASYSEIGKLQLLVAIVNYKTLLHIPRRGLCSNWLKNLTCGDKIKGWIRKGTFNLPENNLVPLVMIGPGTGLAPFRSILQQREMENSSNGPLILFFGCRNKAGDFHCKDDLERMEKNNLIQLFCAFSRDQEDKIYVQHKIKDQTNLLKELLIENNGYVFVAGNSKDMPLAVKTAIIEVIGDKKYVETMIDERRYQEETWG